MGTIVTSTFDVICMVYLILLHIQINFSLLVLVYRCFVDVIHRVDMILAVLPVRISALLDE